MNYVTNINFVQLFQHFYECKKLTIKISVTDRFYDDSVCAILNFRNKASLPRDPFGGLWGWFRHAAQNPAKSERMRTKSIKIRVSDEELLTLKSKKSKARLAEWMRETCLDTSHVIVGNRVQHDPELIRQLASIGNNLNQIAKAVNTADLSAIYRLGQIHNELKRLADAHKAS
jgi:hypothetical protein